MKNVVCILMVSLMIAGCQPKPADNQEANGVPQTLTQEQRSQAAVQLVQIGMEKLGEGDLVGAVQHFETAIDANPKEREAYLILTQTFMRLEEYERATDVLERAVGHFPEDGMFFYLLSLANEGQDNTLPAVLASKRAAELFQKSGDSENAQRAIGLLNALVEKAKNDEAAAADTP